MANFIKVIKQAALEAVAASKPVEVCYGAVKSSLPLVIEIDQKFQLTESFLILTERMRSRTFSVGSTLPSLHPQQEQRYVVMEVMQDASTV